MGWKIWHVAAMARSLFDHEVREPGGDMVPN